VGHTRKTEKHPENQLWHELKRVRAGMLGIERSHHQGARAHVDFMAKGDRRGQGGKPI
jgi:hypothetical protein